jgi:hypothetical protein
MQGFRIVNLKLLTEELGEGAVKDILSTFSCPLNLDVENYLQRKAIEFSKQGISQTHLVFSSFQDNPVLVGYFTLANKTITVSTKNLSKTVQKRISKFSTYNRELKVYYMSAPLIGQLGKNYANNYNKIISGDELLGMACQIITNIQLALGGKFVYLECEDIPRLTDFYERNGFIKFDKRVLDPDETGLKGTYLVQMIRYLSNT